MTLEPKHIQVQVDFQDGLKKMRDQVETVIIAAALHAHDGNRTKAAKLLKVHRLSLWESMKRLKLHKTKSRWRNEKKKK